MLRTTIYAIALSFAASVIWSCGGEHATRSQEMETAEAVGQPLSKLAVQSLSEAVLVVTLQRDEAPVSGAMVEFSRSIAGRAADYQWSGMTDDTGQARVEIASDKVTGYYQARASQDGSQIGSWSSIPVNADHMVMLNLPIGGKARVTSSSMLATSQAIATIGETNESGVTGQAVFTQNGDNIALVIEINHASAGEHAVHIHAKGDCSAPDGTSAGGHWNPTGVAHGKWGEGEFHLGDIGNLTANAQGMGKIELTTNLWEMYTGSDIDVVGKSIIVHAGADDFVSQPSGNAGARIGCGVIEWVR